MSGNGSERLPIAVLTGFLGSGKTTLLRALLDHPRMADSAVIINEFGEIALDHLLVRTATENLLVLNSGCLCCTIRGDLVGALRDLALARLKGEVQFRRVLIETTGLADPAPVLHTLMNDSLAATRFRLDGVITAVDAVYGANHLDQHLESLKQIAVADRLLLTKCDLASDRDLNAMEQTLKRINPGAPVLRVVHGRIDPDRLLDIGPYDPKRKSAGVQEWLQAEAYEQHDATTHHHDHGDDTPLDRNRHDARIQAFCLNHDRPIPWETLSTWIERLLQDHGDALLRLKGIVNVAGRAEPIVIHGVQHVFHPPTRLPVWPSEDRRSRIVLIGRDLDPAVIAHLFDSLARASA